MDLEHLTKTQIILLTLLISFVTSIATGIVTVSLLAQAPPAVTQTINRIVERTVEHAVPTPPGTTKETTVVVKEDDVVADSISKNAPSIVRIRKTVMLESGDFADRVIGIGVVVSKEGLVVTDAALFETGESYSVSMSDGTIFPAKIVSLKASYATALLSLTTTEKTKNYVFVPARLGDAKNVRLGQTVLAFSGTGTQTIFTGIVGNIATQTGNATSTAPYVVSISTSVPADSLLPGSPLINIFGDVIGISTYDSRRRGSAVFTPTNDVTVQIKSTLSLAPSDSTPTVQTATVENSVNN